MFLSDEGPTLETLDFTIHIGSTPTFLYFDLYLNTAWLRSTLRLIHYLNLLYILRFLIKVLLVDHVCQFVLIGLISLFLIKKKQGN